jgi:hypothetical protein
MTSESYRRAARSRVDYEEYVLAFFARLASAR